MAEYNPAGRIDPEQMTLREIDELLEYTGKDALNEVFESLGGGDLTRDDVKVIAKLIELSQRRVNTDFTLDDALDLPFSILQEAAEGLAENPTIETSPASKVKNVNGP